MSHRPADDPLARSPVAPFAPLAIVAALAATAIVIAFAAGPAAGTELERRPGSLFALCHELGSPPLTGHVVIQSVEDDLSHQCTIRLAPRARLWIADSDLLLETWDGRSPPLTIELRPGAVLELYDSRIDAGVVTLRGVGRGRRARAWIEGSVLTVEALRVTGRVELVTSDMKIGTDAGGEEAR